MKCPACVEAGLKSRFSEHAAPKKEGVLDRFFDEDGARHVHDLTIYTFVYACTHGHAYQQQFRSRCPCAGCAWNETPPVKAGSDPIGAAPRIDAA